MMQTDEAPTLTTTHYEANNFIIENTEEEKKRRPDGISNTLTQCQKDNMLIEPCDDPKTCALRGRGEHNQQHLEIGGAVANSLTTVQKDSMVVEPKIIGYSRDAKGNIVSRHFKDTANTLTATNADAHRETTAQYVYQPMNEQFYIKLIHPNSPTRRGSVQDGGDVTPTICSAQQGLCLYEGITPAVMSHPLSHAHEHPKPYTDASPSLRATDYKCPQCVIVQTPNPSTERIIQVGNVVPDHPKFKNRIQGRVYAPGGLSPTLNTHTGGGLEPKIAMPLYRIRKLTPRECFRLMDVDDNRIDTIQSAGISNSQQYKLAGNSIVVSCLYHIFRKMFIDTSVEEPLQLSLFDF